MYEKRKIIKTDTCYLQCIDKPTTFPLYEANWTSLCKQRDFWNSATAVKAASCAVKFVTAMSHKHGRWILIQKSGFLCSGNLTELFLNNSYTASKHITLHS